MRGIFDLIFRYREKESPDKLGFYPEKVHIEAMPERRYLWTSRILVIVSALSISLTIVLASTIYILLPQRGARPRLLEEKDSFWILRDVEPLEKNVYASELLTESLLQKYVLLRHEIPDQQYLLVDRWSENQASEFYALSDEQVFQTFKAKMDDTMIHNFITKNMTREIRFEQSLALRPNLWMIQFRTVTRQGDNVVPVIDRWRAYIRIRFDNTPDGGRISRANPFGMLVSQYSLAYVGKPVAETDNYLDTIKRLRGNALEQ